MKKTSHTRALLSCGVVAGPFYLAVSLAQAMLREGFDLRRHPLSVLAVGPGGWIQTANFVITGLMVVSAAVGFGRELGRGARAMAWFLAGFGVSMIVAAAFPADPMDGFPPGTPLGRPQSVTTTGLLHFACGALAFTCLGISCLCAAWTLSRRHAQSLALLSLASGVAVLLGFFGGMVAEPALGIWLAVVVGWAWLAVMSMRLQTATVAS